MGFSCEWYVTLMRLEGRKVLFAMRESWSFLFARKIQTNEAQYGNYVPEQARAQFIPVHFMFEDGVAGYKGAEISNARANAPPVQN